MILGLAGAAVVGLIALGGGAADSGLHVHNADDAYAVSRDACARLVDQKPLSVAVAGVDELVSEWMTSWNKDEGFPNSAETGCRIGATRALARQ